MPIRQEHKTETTKAGDAGLTSPLVCASEIDIQSMLSVEAVNAHESHLQQCSDAELAVKTVKFRELVLAGTNLEIQVEAFAVVREAGRRVLNLRHTAPDLIAGLVLHRGQIAEIDAGGEEAALAVALPSYLNALGGSGVHVVTFNDSRARRDSE